MGDLVLLVVAGVGICACAVWLAGEWREAQLRRRQAEWVASGVTCVRCGRERAPHGRWVCAACLELP